MKKLLKLILNRYLLRWIFFGDLTVDNMVMAMRFRFLKRRLFRKDYDFLDEIQECQEAITSLKFWALDNRFDVIALSGSLLELIINVLLLTLLGMLII